MDNYTSKKLRNQELFDFLTGHMSQANLFNIFNCGTYISFFADESLKKKKVNKSNFCKNRFCPLCSWRKARKDGLKISILLKYIQEELGYEFIFLTLTAPNVAGSDLSDEIKRYNKSFKNLMQLKEIKKITKGYVRKLEVTYNKERDDYHPHFHVMIAVNKSYFKSRDYIKRNKWLELWKECMNDSSITQVDVKKMNTSDSNAIAEIAKYGAKDADYLISQEVFDIFYRSLKGKQLLTYSGAFKDALKLFNQGELEKYKELDLTEYVYALGYHWRDNSYTEIEKRLLTEEELKQVNNQLIQELEVE
ncbi:protein rep [Intestinibacter sp.]|uniref:protein rep n=1 Tax=Intestinibacter sp. TaxID=1965304 RepID=UPI002A90B342|nr:protein rep [Intestinibacter sp.]MDY5213425.1 protein rep [Intestinibacter sp.]